MRKIEAIAMRYRTALQESLELQLQNVDAVLRYAGADLTAAYRWALDTPNTYDLPAAFKEGPNAEEWAEAAALLGSKDLVWPQQLPTVEHTLTAAEWGAAVEAGRGGAYGPLFLIAYVLPVKLGGTFRPPTAKTLK